MHQTGLVVLHRVCMRAVTENWFYIGKNCWVHQPKLLVLHRVCESSCWRLVSTRRKLPSISNRTVGFTQGLLKTGFTSEKIDKWGGFTWEKTDKWGGFTWEKTDKWCGFTSEKTDKWGGFTWEKTDKWGSFTAEKTDKWGGFTREKTDKCIRKDGWFYTGYVRAGIRDWFEIGENCWVHETGCLVLYRLCWSSHWRLLLNRRKLPYASSRTTGFTKGTFE